MTAAAIEQHALKIEDSDLIDLTFFGPGRMRGDRQDISDARLGKGASRFSERQ